MSFDYFSDQLSMDRLKKWYLDLEVQPGRLKNEFQAICNLMDRYAYGGPPFSLLTGDFPVTTFLPMQSKIMLIF